MARCSTPTQSKMNDLSKEMIDSIIQHLEGDFSSLRNLRLSSKRLNDAATRYLYRKLLLYYHPQSWEKVKLIANCPKLANSVRTLQLANLENLPEITNFKAWKEYIQQFRWEFQSSVGLAGNPNYNDDILLNRYKKFEYWLEGEILMDGYSAGYTGVPILQLSSLTNLHSIESVGSHNLWGPISDPDAVVDVREKATCIARNHWTSLQALHLSLFISSARSVNFRLTSLKLHNLTDTHGYWFDPVFGLKELRTLEIDLRDSEDLETGYWGTWESRIAASWLTRLNSLETFKLIQDPRLNPGVDIIGTLSQMEWPKLRHLDLKHVSTKPWCLEKFVNDHASSLCTLRIIKPTMPMRLWQPCLNSIQQIVTEHRIDFDSTDSFYPTSNDNDRWYNVFTLVPP